jgi:S1-C subfamily serine protease
MPSSHSRASRLGVCLLVASLTALLLAGSPVRAADGAMDRALSDLFDQVSPSVVKVVSYRTLPDAGAAREAARRLVASGVVAGSGRTVVTTDRVAQAGDSLIVLFPDGRQVLAEYAGTHAYLHIAVLRTRSEGAALRFEPGPDAETPPEWVAAVAHGPWDGPKPGYPTLSLSQREAIEPMHVRCADSTATVWRVRAPFYPGNGGGALVSLGGQWIGLITGAVAPTVAPVERSPWDQGVIVPAALVARAVADIESAPRASSQGFLGVVAARRTAPATGTGVEVSGTLEGSPAHRDGIIAGDLLVRFDGTPVRDAEQLTRLVCATSPGKRVAVDLMRKGVGRTLSITLGDRASGEIARARWRVREAERGALSREIGGLEKRLRQLREQLQELTTREDSAQSPAGR